MAFEDDTLETLFDRWNEILKSTPSEDEREQFQRIPLYTLEDKEYFQKRNDPHYFGQWRDLLPAYYQRKVDLMMAILTRLDALDPMQWVVSEITEHIPQLAYFLFVRHLELFVLKDPLRLRKIMLTGADQNKPKWLWELMQKGVTLEEISSLAQQVAQGVLGDILAVTDGYGAFGDLPRNTPRPRIVEANIENVKTPRYLDGLHEYIEDTVLQSRENE
jgi:hypothetical protein